MSLIDSTENQEVSDHKPPIMDGALAIQGILDIICRSTGVRFAAVAKIVDGQWVSRAVKDDAGFGLEPGSTIPIEATLCGASCGAKSMIVVDDFQTDPHFFDHPIAKSFGLRTLVSCPIIKSDGSIYGSLCAMDTRPHVVSAVETREMFRRFSELIAYHVDAIDRAEHSEAHLIVERETAILRDQFIAVLGHDLRNPVAAIEAGITALSRSDLSAKDRRIVDQMMKTTTRMIGLIDDVLDFARGHLGSGIKLKVQGDKHLRPVIEHVIDEVRQANPHRKIVATIDLDGRVEGDPQRIGQLLSNLLGNAIAYGDPNAEIEVSAEMMDGCFVLAVRNGGEPIPPETMETLFKPFKRGQHNRAAGGLGLGLYICSLIAEAHEGQMHVRSDHNETCFEFRKPLLSR